MAREPLPHNPSNAVTRDVWREGDRVHKLLTRRDTSAPAHWRSSTDPRDWNYWRREVEVYVSNLPERFGLAAPRLLDVVDRDDGDVELVVEHVPGRHAATMTIADLEASALALGRAQARPPVDAPWLSRGFLRAYTVTRAVDWSLLDDDAAWQAPLMREHFSPELRAGLRALHADRERLLRLAEAAPRTTAHLDAWPNNIIMRDDAAPVFLDWSFTGDGAVGEDVANLVPDAVFDLMFDAADLPEIEHRVTEAYRNGLRDGGSGAAERDVWTGLRAAVVKYDFLAPFCLAEAAADPGSVRAYGGVDAVDLHERFAARAAGLELCARWAHEALTGRPGAGP